MRGGTGEVESSSLGADLMLGNRETGYLRKNRGGMLTKSMSNVEIYINESGTMKIEENVVKMMITRGILGLKELSYLPSMEGDDPDS